MEQIILVSTYSVACGTRDSNTVCLFVFFFANRRSTRGTKQARMLGLSNIRQIIMQNFTDSNLLSISKMIFSCTDHGSVKCLLALITWKY